MRKFILPILIYGLFSNSIYDLFNNYNQECNPKAPTRGCSRCAIPKDQPTNFEFNNFTGLS